MGKLSPEKLEQRRKNRSIIKDLRLQISNLETSLQYYRERYEKSEKKMQELEQEKLSLTREIRSSRIVLGVAENLTIQQLLDRLNYAENLLAAKTLSPEQYQEFMKTPRDPRQAIMTALSEDRANY